MSRLADWYMQADTIPIGVSKKCCFCCTMLRQLLEEWCEQERLDHPRFTLPGTHGVVYPWVSPPGVPVEVLRKLRAELLALLFDVVRFGYGVKSTGSSTGWVQSSGVPIFHDDDELDSILAP